MSDIVICEFTDEGSVEDLRRDYEVLYEPDLVDRPDDLAAAIAGCQALIVRNRTRVTAALLDGAPGLQALGRLGVGLDNIDLEACKARGIPVIPATGANSVSVAEYVVAGILMLFRGRAYHSTAQVLAGEWPRTRLMGREAEGRRLGLVGFGDIARTVAPRCQALEMTVCAYDPFIAADDPVWKQMSVDPVTLDDLLEQCDAISLHLPLTDQTRHLIDAAALSRMKEDAVLINAARGGVVDDAALARALKDGRLAGAMLDVFEDEPLPAGSVFEGVPNLILTPHIAGVTHEGTRKTGAVVAAGVRRVLEGK